MTPAESRKTNYLEIGRVGPWCQDFDADAISDSQIQLPLEKVPRWPCDIALLTTSYMWFRRCWRPWSSAVACERARSYSAISDHGLKLDLARPVQSYISRSSDPYVNLSIEHHLLQKSAPDSAILFLYTNRPSIIIGRNQNPWLEVNLGLVQSSADFQAHQHDSTPQTQAPTLGAVDLVRRRSGGGTVFHDQGNVNWTVISPSSSFTRDKHAEMVVRALRHLGIQRARVNERHDIVLDQGQADHPGLWGPKDDAYSTPWKSEALRSLKVSGSAYKLTRQRALHHGTALLNSPNLKLIPNYLRSPAKGFIKGRGVDSVSSPVGNILLSNEDFIHQVQREFSAMYGGEVQATAVDDKWLDVQDVMKGYEELKSLEWTFIQTPQFTFSNRLEGDDVSKESIHGPSTSAKVVMTHPTRKYNTESNLQIHLDIKHGAITSVDLQAHDEDPESIDALYRSLDSQHLHEIRDWCKTFTNAGLESGESMELARWVQRVLP